MDSLNLYNMGDHFYYSMYIPNWLRNDECLQLVHICMGNVRPMEVQVALYSVWVHVGYQVHYLVIYDKESTGTLIAATTANFSGTVKEW